MPLLKKYLPLLLLALVSLPACKHRQEDILAGISKHYNEINNNLSKYKMKRVDDLTIREGGYITGYYRDDEVKKIIAEHYYDDRRTFTEYYFDDGFIILAISRNFTYNRPQSYTEEKAKALGDTVWYDDKKTKLETNTYWFDKNHLIKWTGPDGNDIKPGTAAFIDKESEIWGETKILLGQLAEEEDSRQ